MSNMDNPYPKTNQPVFRQKGHTNSKNRTDKWNFSTDRKLKKHNKHQHSTHDEGGQAMGEDIDITQIMMADKQCVKNWGMHRWASEASIQVKGASSNNDYEAESKAF